MTNKVQESFIHTNKGRCRICYACVRECPAKAIQIHGGQALVIYDRCIGCGNCVKVCSQEAKLIVSEKDKFNSLLESGGKLAAILDTSFIAEYPDNHYRKIISALRLMGFFYVCDSSFGADLVSAKMKEILYNHDGKKYISSSCPAACFHIQQFNPELIPNLLPVVSPMIASAKVVKEKYGKDTSVVYIGPCVARRGEAVNTEVELVITFLELNDIIKSRNIDLNLLDNSEFDPPLGRKGLMSGISIGMINSINEFEDLLGGKVIPAEGRTNFLEALKEFGEGVLEAKMLDLWVCEGCISGAGLTNPDPLYRRRSRTIKFTKETIEQRDPEKWKTEYERFRKLNLHKNFEILDRRWPDPDEAEIKKILNRNGKQSERDELNCGACGYSTCREFAKAVYYNMAEDDMCLPNTIVKLHKTVNQLNKSNRELATTKEALAQSEKLANMGQLSAGIAHELNNPLSIVLMYANLLIESVEKNSQEHEDINIIIREVDRCRKIVSGLLNFARKNKITLTPANICELAEHCVKISNLPENIHYRTECLTDNPVINVDRDQIIQVFHNLINNAVQAMPEGGKLRIKIFRDNDNMKIAVTDTGTGIPEQNLKRIFEPFFTTKKHGQGTGLGLSISYGIIKMHQGAIFVKSNDNPAKGQTGTTFTISIPVNIVNFNEQLIQ